MNYELERIWNEAIMLFTKYCLDDQINENDKGRGECTGDVGTANKSTTAKPEVKRPL
jgi:hypothetical protein